MPVALLFDLDNTLIDRTAAHLRYCRDFADRFFIDRDVSDREEAVQEMVERDDFGYASREQYFEWLTERFASGILTSAELWQDYQTRLPGCFRKNPAILDLVERLAAKYRLAIVSNGSSRNQRRKLAQTGLMKRFSRVFISGEVGVEKPNPVIFQLALDALDCDAGNALFIGDDPHRDIAGAAQVGVKTCWIRMGRPLAELPVQPTYDIETVLDLENVLIHECKGTNQHA